MTDRQTDIYQQRSQWWIGTAYDDNMLKLEDAKTYPKCVKHVYGGREECPTTKRIHFQYAIECHGQQRAAFFRDWLPGVHFQKARSKEAVKKYALKEDTAIGSKNIIENPNRFYHMHDLLEMIAVEWYRSRSEGLHNGDLKDDEYRKHCTNDFYWMSVSRILERDHTLASSFANPAMQKMWENTGTVWKKRALSITEPVTDSLEDVSDEDSDQE